MIHELTRNLSINHNQRKCFIFDLDGTIIFNNKPLSLENEVLLKNIKDRGHELIFATGRPLRDFKMVMPKWSYEQPLVLFSGGASIINSNIVRSSYIPLYLVEEIVNLCVKNKHRFIIDNLSHYYYPDLPNMTFGFLDTNVNQYRVDNLQQMLNTEVYKILIFDMEAHQFFIQYANTNNLLVKHHSYDSCFDLVSSTCDKYLGVLPFINDYANEDVFVFGNDFNDIELFKHFKNSILLGDIPELKKLVKLNLPYDDKLNSNFAQLLKVILGN